MYPECYTKECCGCARKGDPVCCECEIMFFPDGTSSRRLFEASDRPIKFMRKDKCPKGDETKKE